MNKEQTYKQVLQSIESLTDGETDPISRMSTIACELYHAFDAFIWVGFYRRVDKQTLKVGPYQGTHGCLTIDIERGVCGRCAREAAIQVENDVSKIPYHIACSKETKSEIVLPILGNDGQVRAVLDIDSSDIDCFDETDAAYLEKICQYA